MGLWRKQKKNLSILYFISQTKKSAQTIGGYTLKNASDCVDNAPSHNNCRLNKVTFNVFQSLLAGKCRVRLVLIWNCGSVCLHKCVLLRKHTTQRCATCYENKGSEHLAVACSSLRVQVSCFLLLQGVDLKMDWKSVNPGWVKFGYKNWWLQWPLSLRQFCKIELHAAI